MMWLLIALGIGLMTFGADWVVGGASRISRHFHISAFVISALIIGLGANIPETAVTFLSAGTSLESMIMPTMVTSNIFNILGVIAVIAIIKPIYIQHVSMREIKILLVSSALLVIMLYDGRLDWVEGTGLLLIFIYYCLGAKPHANPHDTFYFNWWETMFMVFAGTMLIYAGSHLFLQGINRIVEELHMSGSSLGALIAAPGTTGPEIIVSILSIIRKKPQILIGNIVGSCVSHIVFVSGIAGIIAQPAMLLPFDALLMLLATILFCIDIVWRKKITRLSGVIYLILLFLYFATVLV